MKTKIRKQPLKKSLFVVAITLVGSSALGTVVSAVLPEIGITGTMLVNTASNIASSGFLLLLEKASGKGAWVRFGGRHVITFGYQ